MHPMREHVLSGEHFLSTAIGNCLAKLVIRSRTQHGVSGAELNVLSADAMRIILSLLRLTHLPEVNNQMDKDSVERLTVCLRGIASPDSPEVVHAFLGGPKQSFESFLSESNKVKSYSNGAEGKKVRPPPSPPPPLSPPPPSPP